MRRLFTLSVFIMILALALVVGGPTCGDDDDDSDDDADDDSLGDDDTAGDSCAAVVQHYTDGCPGYVDYQTLYQAVCVEYQDPECLAWCWENNATCEAVLSCYDNNQCEPVDTAGTWEGPGGLLWENPPPTGLYGRAEGEDYCAALELAGYTDWRLPTISELRSLELGCGEDCGVTDSCLLSSCKNDACNGCPGVVGPGTDGCFWDPELTGECYIYWSSSPYADDPLATGWAVNFAYGNILNHHVGTENLVRCVR